MNAVLSFQIFTVFLFVLAIWALIKLYREHRKEHDSKTKKDEIKIFDTVESFERKDTIKFTELFEELLVSMIQDISSKKKTTAGSKEARP